MNNYKLSYSCTRSVDEGSTMTRLDCINSIIYIRIGNITTDFQKIFPAIQFGILCMMSIRKIYIILFFQNRHIIIRPVNNNGLQFWKIFTNGDYLHSRLTTLADTNLRLRMLQNILTSIRRIGCINTSSNATCHPSTLKTEVVFGRVKPNHSTHFMLLKAQIEKGLGKPITGTGFQKLLHRLFIILFVGVSDIFLTNHCRIISPRCTVLSELLNMKCVKILNIRQCCRFRVKFKILVTVDFNFSVNLAGTGVSHEEIGFCDMQFVSNLCLFKHYGRR